MQLSTLGHQLHLFLLSEKIKKKAELFILWVALTSFLVHLMLIGLVHFQLIHFSETSDLLYNPIAAIYTPFSFILVYEVYLLIYYLPQSTAIYISKQYEIITLIIIRRLFKDLSNISLTANWFSVSGDLQFTYDLITSLILFYLLFLFHKQRRIFFRSNTQQVVQDRSVTTFITAKKTIATALVPILLIIAFYSFSSWVFSFVENQQNSSISFKNINNIFFEQFFTILIVADVMLLLFSFFHTDEFHKVIRNSGFLISTILLRISFSVEGITNNVLIISAILFGLLILVIHNQFEKQVILNNK